MGKQRDLLDKTFRQQQGQGDPKDGGAQGLQKQQNDLEKELQDSLKGMDGKSAEKMREAGKAMGEAAAGAGPQGSWPMPAAPRTRRWTPCARARRQLADEADQERAAGGRARKIRWAAAPRPGQYRNQDSRRRPIWRAPAPFWKNCAAAPRR